MSLIKMLTAVQQVDSIQVAAGRSLQQFTNSFDTVLASFNAFNEALPAAGLDPDTIADIDAIKAEVIATAIAALEARLAQLAAL